MKRGTERMSAASFKVMSFLFNVADLLYPTIDKRVKTFGIREGMVIVDYGCGPGRYTMRFSRLVGDAGKVYAVDIHEMAVEAVKSKISKYRFTNVVPVLARGYDSTLPDHMADVVCAIDMFFGVRNPTEFLKELHRITKAGGTLVIDDGHQSRAKTKQRIFAAGFWSIKEETRDHLKCKPV